MLLLKSIRRLTLGIRLALDAILFIRRQTRETEESHRNVVRSFVRKEITMMRASKTFDERQPLSGVFLELPKLVRIDDVAEITGDPRLEITAG